MDKESIQAAYNIFTEVWKAYCNCRKKDELKQSDCDQCADKLLDMLHKHYGSDQGQIASDLVDALLKNCRKDQIKKIGGVQR